MPLGLQRFYGQGHLHYITCSCFHREPLLGTADRRDLFLQILEEVRCQYRFVVAGYVVMPEHFHQLISEPQVGDPSKVMQVLKQRVARRILSAADPSNLGYLSEGHFWQRRFYDFNVRTERKHIEKLRYMHRNPVKRGLVSEPELWPWSSFRFYAYGEEGVVKVLAGWEREVSASATE